MVHTLRSLAVEHVIGRRMRLDAVQAYGRVVPGRPYWSLIGWAGLAASLLIMAFYTDVAGWVRSLLGLGGQGATWAA